MSSGQDVGPSAIVWDPATDLVDSVPIPVIVFCNAMEQMADGRIPTVGGTIAGHNGLPAANLFDASSES
jgi:hypothetical protein